MNELLSNSEPGAIIDSQTDVNDELLTELSVGLIDEEKKGPKVTTQLACVTDRQTAGIVRLRNGSQKLVLVSRCLCIQC